MFQNHSEVKNNFIRKVLDALHVLVSGYIHSYICSRVLNIILFLLPTHISYILTKISIYIRIEDIRQERFSWEAELLSFNSKLCLKLKIKILSFP